MRKSKKSILKLVQDIKKDIGQSFIKAYDIGDDRIVVIVREKDTYQEQKKLISLVDDVIFDYSIKNGVMPLILFQSKELGDKPQEDGVLVG